MNFILGSGIVGRIAKCILGDGWTIIPFNKSRYYEFYPSLADDFLVCNPKVDDFLTDIGIPFSGGRIFLKRGFSVGGQLLFNNSPMTIEPYLKRTYEQLPKIPSDIFNDRMVYSLSCNKLYSFLFDKVVEHLRNGTENFGDSVESINLEKKEIKTNKRTFEFDKIISTIPLNALYKFLHKQALFESNDVFFYYLISEQVDIEGCTTAFVVDSHIEFHKVSLVKPDHYLFWCYNILDNPYTYLGSIIGHRMEIEGSWFVEEAVPTSPPPSDLKKLEEDGIFCVGSNAQWDDFMDVSSTILRLIRYANTI